MASSSSQGSSSGAAGSSGTLGTMQSVFSSLASFTISAAKTGTTIAKKGASATRATVHSAADKVGLKDQVESVERAAKAAINEAKVGAGKRLGDITRAANKARRLANKALEFEDEDDELNSADYDLLLAAAGATEKTIQIYQHHSQTYNVPAGSALVWKVRVRRHEIGFAVREHKDKKDRKDKDGEGSGDIEPMNAYRSDTLIQGKLAPSKHARSIVLVFENKPSSSSPNLNPKQVAYWVAIGANVSLDDDALGAARTKEVTAAEEGPQE